MAEAGLLEFLKTPAGQGLLAAGLGVAANAGRGGTWNAIGRGGLMGLAGYAGAQDLKDRSAQEAQEREVRAIQLAQLKAAADDQKLANETARRFYTAPTGGAGQVDAMLPAEFRTGIAPVAAQPGGFDMRGYVQARMQQNPVEGMKLAQLLQKEHPINKVDPDKVTPASLAKFAQTGNYGDLVFRDKLHFADSGGATVGLDQYTGQQVSTSPKTGNPFSDLIVAGPGGTLVPNTPLVNVKTGISAAGAPRVNVNTDKSYFGNVAEGLAKLDVAAIDAGRAAPERIQSARRVKEVLAQNPITGTGANERLEVNKAFATAGLIDPARANATEALVTELAAQTLDSIKTSGLGSGQGFTNNDRQFLQDARSGRIQMTPANIHRIADLNERSATEAIKRANSVIGKLKSNKDSGGMGQSLDLIEIPSMVRRPAPLSPSSQSSSSIDDLINKYAR